MNEISIEGIKTRKKEIKATKKKQQRRTVTGRRKSEIFYPLRVTTIPENGCWKKMSVRAIRKHTWCLHRLSLSPHESHFCLFHVVSDGSGQSFYIKVSHQPSAHPQLHLFSQLCCNVQSPKEMFPHPPKLWTTIIERRSESLTQVQNSRPRPVRGGERGVFFVAKRVAWQWTLSFFRFWRTTIKKPARLHFDVGNDNNTCALIRSRNTQSYNGQTQLNGCKRSNNTGPLYRY